MTQLCFSKKMDVTYALQCVRDNLDRPTLHTFVKAVKAIAQIPCETFALHPNLRESCYDILQTHIDNPQVTLKGLEAFELLLDVLYNTLMLDDLDPLHDFEWDNLQDYDQRVQARKNDLMAGDPT